MNGTLNKVMLIGHLGDDVKIHFFDGGGCVGRFPIATNEVYTNKTSGEKVTNTDWHNVVLRNKAAEICEKYLSKGDKIYIEGRLKTRKWQDQSGNDRYSTEVVLRPYRGELTLLDSRSETNNLGSALDQQSISHNNSLEGSASGESEILGDLDDEIPF